MSNNGPPVRVIIRLPFNRPEQPLDDPAPVEWTSDKENILWEVIAKSRAADSGGTDWKGLAAHLEVPLPYLLFRAQARYEEDLRGLQLQGIRGNSIPQSASSPTAPFPGLVERPSLARKVSDGLGNTVKLSPSAARLHNHPGLGLGVRTRLNSLGQRSKKTSSSSVLTLRNGIHSQSHRSHAHAPLDPPSPSSSAGSSDEDEEAARAERADKEREAQEELELKLKNLERLMTSDALGLVSPVSRVPGSVTALPSPTTNGKGKEVDRGRAAVPAYGSLSRLPPQGSQGGHVRSTSGPLPAQGHRADSPGSRSQSVSSLSADSPQGSVPSIPSPPTEESRRSSPIGIPTRDRGRARPQRPLSSSATKSSSPPTLSPKSVKGQMRYQPLAPLSRTRTGASEQGSINGSSSASSFSDISEMSLSSSALESALLSNIRGGGSRLSSFARNRFSGRGGAV